MKKLKDERIEAASHVLAAKMFWLTSALIMISLAVKISLGLKFRFFGLEILCLLASFGYVIICKLKKGMLFARNLDDAMKKLHNADLAQGFMIDFWILIGGTFFLVLLDFENILWYASCIILFMIPGAIFTIASVKNGWLIWGGKKRQNDGKHALKKRVFLASIFYGIFTGWSDLYHDGTFHANELPAIIFMAASWGIMFYFAFKFLLDIGEKKANKQVGSDDCGIEKQANENSKN